MALNARAFTNRLSHPALPLLLFNSYQAFIDNTLSLKTIPFMIISSEISDMYLGLHYSIRLYNFLKIGGDSEGDLTAIFRKSDRHKYNLHIKLMYLC